MQPCGAPQVPSVEPVGMLHGRPAQQSAVVVQAPPSGTQAEPHLLLTHGRPQQSALDAWRGDPANVDAAQEAFLHRARMNALATAGDWSADMEQAVHA